MLSISTPISLPELSGLPAEEGRVTPYKITSGIRPTSHASGRVCHKQEHHRLGKAGRSSPGPSSAVKLNPTAKDRLQPSDSSK